MQKQSPSSHIHLVDVALLAHTPNQNYFKHSVATTSFFSLEIITAQIDADCFSCDLFFRTLKCMGYAFMAGGMSGGRLCEPKNGHSTFHGAWHAYFLSAFLLPLVSDPAASHEGESESESEQMQNAIGILFGIWMVEFEQWIYVPVSVCAGCAPWNTINSNWKWRWRWRWSPSSITTTTI